MHHLIFLFLVSYAVVAWSLYHLSANETLKISISLLLLAGGAFVWIVLNLCLKSVNASVELQERAVDISLHETCTSLPNYRMFRMDMEQKVKDVESLIIVSIRFQKYHEICDVLGYARGENLLKAVAERLDTINMGVHVLYDFGSCNYCVTFEDKGAVHDFVNEVSNSMISPFNVDGSSIQMECNMGIATFPEHGTVTVELLSHANMAANQARERSISYFHYQPWLGRELADRLEISDRLRKAIANNELKLHYQPIFKGHGDSIISVEALLRWPQKDNSYIPPEYFVRVAEHERIIHMVTEWVIGASFRQLSDWQEQGIDICMNVNLSSHDLMNPKLIQILETCREKYGLRAEKLVLELTESAVMEDIDKASYVMECLEKLGYCLAIDDFGTGYSSLHRLKTLPINQIKIDREFVKEIVGNDKDSSIVYAAASIARTFRCSVTAEGVDSKLAADQLIKLGCDYLQGFYLSKPLPPEEVFSLLQENQRKADISTNEAA